MKRILATALAALLLLGVFTTCAGAVGIADLTGEQLEQLDQIYKGFLDYCLAFKPDSIPAILAALTACIDANALEDGTKLEEFKEKVQAAEKEAQTTEAAAAFKAFMDVVETFGEATVAMFLAGTLKAQMEANYDAYLAEVADRYQPLNSAYLKADFLALMDSYAKLGEFQWALWNSNLSEEEKNTIGAQFGSLMEETSLRQHYNAGNWAEAKQELDGVIVKIRELLTAAGVFSYAVTYDANGGSGAPAAQTKTEGVTLALSNTIPTRDGHTFKGWATSPTGAVAYAAGADYAANAAVTLYAVWEADAPPITPATYAVAYDANGGSGAPAAQTKTEGVTLALSGIVPTRDGHTFKGWATSPTGAVVYAAGADYAANAAVTLYAVWEANAVVTPRYFWSDWPEWLQFVLKYVLFGWLWMRWVKPI